MRRGVGAAALMSVIALLSAGTRTAWAAAGGNGESGADQSAGGELLGGDTAEVVAKDSRHVVREGRPRADGGNIVCRWFGIDPQTDSPNGPVDWAKLRDPPRELVGAQVSVFRSCEDGRGNYVSNDIVTLTLPTGQPPRVDPRQLALLARSRLPLPLPAARTSPEGDQTVNLETWLWVDNWEAQARSATAGGVTAFAVATPVEQRWTFGMPGEQKVCHDAGTPYDLSKQPSEQSTDCGYTFRHSSAGQPDDTVQVTATVIWHVTWRSNIGASGDLGVVSRTVTIPTRVAEHQALNETRGQGQ